MDFGSINLKDASPYPEINSATDCPRTCAILSDLISAQGGEVSLVMQFTFQSAVADKINADLGQFFEEAGIMNMHHIGLLMHAICSFGGMPKFEDGNSMPYTANYINYNSKLKDMLNNDITATTNSINNYNHAIKLVKNDSLKNLLARIVKDKQKQLNALNTILNNVNFYSV